MIGSRMMIRIAPAMSNVIPDRIIVVILTTPEPYTIAFCGVDTGNMKPNDAANVAARAGTNGLTPAAIATGITMGTTTAADAVLLVVSDTMIARITAKIVIGTTLDRPSASLTDVPMVSASPVSEISEPKMMPQPNRMIVPQSILAASLQRSVNSRSFQSVGSRKSSRRAEHGDHAFVESVADELVGA